jgi:cyanophycin synthetase
MRLAGSRADFVASRPTAEAGVVRVAVDSEIEELGRAAPEAALELGTAAAHGRPFDVESVVAALRDVDHEHKPGPSTSAIIAAAEARGIPWLRRNRGSLSAWTRMS